MAGLREPFDSNLAPQPEHSQSVRFTWVQLTEPASLHCCKTQTVFGVATSELGADFLKEGSTIRYLLVQYGPLGDMSHSI